MYSYFKANFDELSKNYGSSSIHDKTLAIELF